MDSIRLKYFLEVAKHLNFSEASKQLYVSQSTISKQIALLEEELQVKLFIRDKRSVELTPPGAVFLKKAKELLDHYNEAIILTQKAHKGIVGTLNIGVISYMEFLPEFLMDFQKAYPLIEVNLKHLNPAGIIQSINKREIDLGFTVSHGVQNNTNLMWESFRTDKMMLIVSKHHHLATQRTVPISVLSDEPIVIMSPSVVPENYEQFITLCKSEGFNPKISYEVERIETLYLLVESGMGISVLPKYISSIRMGNTKMIPFAGQNATYELGITMLKEQTNPSLRIFLEEFRSNTSMKR
ncbi:LysR family transcriptional regulator [Niallia sp. Krafla_26]|uniref:LysR family transcriptional regulator n=1 Tax=Niallia sp. Krafla_26 TaxID=3064703 RepID=UPI003D171E11